jgi:hypothetical protein
LKHEPDGFTGLSKPVFLESVKEDQPECADLLELGRFNSVDYDRKPNFLSEEFCELVSNL